MSPRHALTDAQVQDIRRLGEDVPQHWTYARMAEECMRELNLPVTLTRQSVMEVLMNRNHIDTEWLGCGRQLVLTLGRRQAKLHREQD